MLSSKVLKWLPNFLSRLRLHEEKVIKDRRHHLKTYPNCFVAKELIDWLIEHKEASDRETAIKLMQKLADRGIIHHGEWGDTKGEMKDYIFIPDMNLPIYKIKHLTLIASNVPFPSFISFLPLRGIWVYFHGLLYTFSFCMCIFLQHVILFLNHYREP